MLRQDEWCEYSAHHAIPAKHRRRMESMNEEEREKKGVSVGTHHSW